MKKTPALRHVTTMAVNSLLLCTVALTACTDEDGVKPVDDAVVAIAVSTPQFLNYPTTTEYLGPLFQRAV